MKKLLIAIIAALSTTLSYAYQVDRMGHWQDVIQAFNATGNIRSLDWAQNNLRESQNATGNNITAKESVATTSSTGGVLGSFKNLASGILGGGAAATTASTVTDAQANVNSSKETLNDARNDLKAERKDVTAARKEVRAARKTGDKKAITDAQSKLKLERRDATTAQKETSKARLDKAKAVNKYERAKNAKAKVGTKKKKTILGN